MKRELVQGPSSAVAPSRKAKLESHRDSGFVLPQLEELDKPGLCFADVSEWLLNVEFVRGGGAPMQEALVKVVERGDAVSAELALRRLAELAPWSPPGLLERVFGAIGRVSCPASVLQQALRSLSTLKEVAEPLRRLAIDAARDSRGATRAECLRTLAYLGDDSSSNRALEEGLKEFAGQDPDAAVRAAALDGLLLLFQRGELRISLAALWESALCGFGDDESHVRKSAVRLLWQLGMKCGDEEAPSPPQWRLRDRVFVLLCAAILDPSLAVRESAARLIGQLPLAGHYYMMQSLSKKNLLEKRPEYGGGGGGGGELLPQQPPAEGGQWGSALLLEQQAVGAFVHALEEEFAEVRKKTQFSFF